MDAYSKAPQDDWLTICAIAWVAGMLGDVLHEGVGHACVALLTGTPSGVLSTVAWSSGVDSRLVAAGGTLVNLAAGLGFLLALRSAKTASVHTRLFLLLACAVNLLSGTGYFFFSGVSNFGDWAVVIAGAEPHWLWRTLLVVGGITLYYGATFLIGCAVVLWLGVAADAQKRIRKILWVSYAAGVALAVAGALRNPVGQQLIWESALPAAAGGSNALLWLQHYIPRRLKPERAAPSIGRSYAWIAIAAALAVPFLFVLGRGITLSR